MEEFEISGAREWQVEGTGIPSRPKGSGPPGQTHFEKAGGGPAGGSGPRQPPIRRDNNGNGDILGDPETPGGPQPSADANRKNQPQPQYMHTRPNNGEGTTNPGRGTTLPATSNNRPSEPTREANARSTSRPVPSKFRLPFPYTQLKQRIGESFKDMPLTMKDDEAFFEDLSKRAKAFIKAPQRDTDRDISIYGNAEQLRNARRVLYQLLAICNVTSTKKKTDSFAKIMSYSETKEANLNLIEKNDSILQQLRQKPEPGIILPEIMVFLWPGDELPLEDSLGPNLESLDPLRREFGCYIYIDDEDPNLLRVDAYDHQAIISLVHRLRAKWAELMANRHVKIKLYLVQPPGSDLTKNEVAVVKVAPFGSSYAYPTPLLYCAPSMPSLQIQGWRDKNKLARAKNDVRLREAVETSLQSLRFLRGHVRMRVNFGTFVLDDYRVPKDSKPRYSFEEFRSMLFHPKTKGHLIPGLEFSEQEDLIGKCAAASDLLAPYSATAQSLEEADPLYAVNFEFEGENATLLRLEAEFAKSPGSGLFEVSQRRWVKPQGANNSSDKQPPLQVGVIDFESSDWQLEIKALEFHEPDTISQSLRTFSHSIHFSRGPTDGLRGQGKRRVTFSEGVPVARLIEKSALRYRLKGTSYVLEIARYDEYGRVSMPRPAPPNVNINLGTFTGISDIPVTTWGASVFDLEWDNMLGQHANFRLGYTAEWSPSLNTFFPCRDDPNPSDVRAGFSQFADLIQRVAVLLGPKENPEPGKENTETPGAATAQPGRSSTHTPAGPATTNPSFAGRALGKNIKSWADVVGKSAQGKPT